MGIVSFGRRDFLGTDAWAERKPKMICERCQKEFETLNNGHCPKCWEELLVFMRRNIKQLDATTPTCPGRWRRPCRCSPWATRGPVPDDGGPGQTPPPMREKMKNEDPRYRLIDTESSFCPNCEETVTLLTDVDGEGPMFYICFSCKKVSRVGVGEVKHGQA